ncbi:MAG TPA: inosine/xanthosine triphosphatase [Candidatus Woesebacteria bacterium]|nr:inosine/xanthosine triphosphatase [Candidatus Woesebacteria bacterium]HNS65272.1 inosine/xanthosine triphosphatase [Candidatus Woesebacteria bacterium]
MQKTPSYIFVGSTNPVKINAVRIATANHWPNVDITGFEVPSLVSEQPRSDVETRQGAQNRAQAVLMLGKSETESQVTSLGVGLEGGVFTDSNGELWSTVWASVTDQSGQFWDANGARFKVPSQIAKLIEAGEEMGPALSQLFGGADIKRTNGAIGMVTNNFVTRTEEYSAICKLAIGLWYGQDWADSL